MDADANPSWNTLCTTTAEKKTPSYGRCNRCCFDLTKAIGKCCVLCKSAILATCNECNRKALNPENIPSETFVHCQNCIFEMDVPDVDFTDNNLSQDSNENDSMSLEEGDLESFGSFSDLDNCPTESDDDDDDEENELLSSVEE